MEIQHMTFWDRSAPDPPLRVDSALQLFGFVRNLAPGDALLLDDVLGAHHVGAQHCRGGDRARWPPGGSPTGFAPGRFAEPTTIRSTMP